MPSVDTLGSRVQTATLRMYLDRGLAVKFAARCATSADALWFSTLLQGALLVERQLQNSKNAPLARALDHFQAQRQDDRVSLDMDIPESDLATLIQTNGLALHF